MHERWIDESQRDTTQAANQSDKIRQALGRKQRNQQCCNNHTSPQKVLPPLCSSGILAADIPKHAIFRNSQHREKHDRVGQLEQSGGTERKQTGREVSLLTPSYKASF